MAYQLGDTTLPIANVARLGGEPSEPIGDPGLTTLLSWCAAVLTYEVGAAWDDLVPGEPIVRTQSPHDPREEDFSTIRLPQLFAYREDGKAVRNDDGHWGEERPVTLLWSYPPIAQNKIPMARGIPVAIGRALIRAVGEWNGRHPSWVVAGDTDSFAAAYGSSVLTHAGLATLAVGMVRNANVRVGQAEYEGVSVELLAREDLEPVATGLGTQTVIVIRRDEATPTAPGPFDGYIYSPPLTGFSGGFLRSGFM
jgi:hypothetical protein